MVGYGWSSDVCVCVLCVCARVSCGALLPSGWNAIPRRTPTYHTHTCAFHHRARHSHGGHSCGPGLFSRQGRVQAITGMLLCGVVCAVCVCMVVCAMVSCSMVLVRCSMVRYGMIYICGMVWYEYKPPTGDIVKLLQKENIFGASENSQ